MPRFRLVQAASTVSRSSTGASSGSFPLRSITTAHALHALATEAEGLSKASSVDDRAHKGASRSLHAASSSSDTDSPSSSDRALLNMAQSLQKRLKALQMEHTESQVLHQSRSAKDTKQRGAAAHILQPNARSGTQQAQPRQESQWARYKQHRASAQRHNALQQVDSLPACSLSSTLDSDSEVSGAMSNDDDAQTAAEMQKLRALLNAPISQFLTRPQLPDDDMSEDEDSDLAMDSAQQPATPSKQSSRGGSDSLAQAKHETSDQAWAGSRAQSPSGDHARQRQADRGQDMKHDSMGMWGNLPGTAPGTPQSEAVPISKQLLLQAGIIGVPNSGKSTLTNALVGTKVTAVSSKTNTTGVARLGAFTEGTCQVALYDTPGVVHTRFLHGPRHARSVKSAWGTASDCEMLMCIVDAYRQIVKPDIRVYQLVEELSSGPLPDWNPLPTTLILNKVDLLSPEQSLSLKHLRDRFLQLFPFEEVFCVSARHGAGVQELKQYLLKRCEPGKWVVRSWESTDMGPSELATEIVREKLFKRLYKELPYRLDIVDAAVNVHRDGSIRIEKHIMVPDRNVRAIVVGTKGAVIGEVGIGARRDLEAMLDRRVHLILEVKVASK